MGDGGSKVGRSLDGYNILGEVQGKRTLSEIIQAMSYCWVRKLEKILLGRMPTTHFGRIQFVQLVPGILKS